MMPAAHVGSLDLATGLGPSMCFRTPAVRFLQDAFVFEPCPHGSPHRLAGRYAVAFPQGLQPVD